MKLISKLTFGLLLSAVSLTHAARADVLTLAIDASDKVNFVYYGLENGVLVPVTEKDAWILGVRRYIFKTPTGSDGAHVGGAFMDAGAGFAGFLTCSGLTFTPDVLVTMAGYTISANMLMTSEWYDYDEEGVVAPLDKFFAISSDGDCLKVKIDSYATGVYSIRYSLLK